MFGERKYKVQIDTRAAVALTIAVQHFSRCPDATDFPQWLWDGLSRLIDELSEKIDKHERIVVSSALAEFMRTEKI